MVLINGLVGDLEVQRQGLLSDLETSLAANSHENSAVGQSKAKKHRDFCLSSSNLNASGSTLDEG